MNLISAETTNEAATLIERAKQLHADTTALVDDIKEFSLRRGDSIPKGLSVNAANELDEWLFTALGVDEMCSMLDVTISTIVSYHDSGTFEPFTDADVAERVAMADLTLATLQSGDTAGHGSGHLAAA